MQSLYVNCTVAFLSVNFALNFRYILYNFSHSVSLSFLSTSFYKDGDCFIGNSCGISAELYTDGKVLEF